jgi:tetratricopeptide (TPR) repeat protein
MDCPRCGKPVEQNAGFCSNCGLKIEQQDTRILQSPAVQQNQAGAAPASQRQGCRSGLTVAGTAVLVVVIIVMLTAAAVYLGLRDRESSRTHEADTYYDQGEAYMAQGQYELAIAAYDQALAINPDHASAGARREEARSLLSGVPTATSALQGETIDALWEVHQLSVDQSDWEQTVATADNIIARDPGYRREELDGNLFDALVTLGDRAVQDDRLEEAIRYYDRALAVRPGDAGVVHSKNLARLYMDGIRFYGADWASAIERFATLYSIAPAYKDVAVRLKAAYVAYGQELSSEDKWCEAVTQYALALQIAEDSQVTLMAQNATAQCEAADAAEGGTPGVPVDTPSGTFAGWQVQPEAVGNDKMFIRGHVFDSSGAPVVGTRVKIQAWDFSTYAITDGTGQFSFDGLANPVPYTLTLADLPSQPLEVETVWGRLSWVVFEQAK